MATITNRKCAEKLHNLHIKQQKIQEASARVESLNQQINALKQTYDKLRQKKVCRRIGRRTFCFPDTSAQIQATAIMAKIGQLKAAYLIAKGVLATANYQLSLIVKALHRLGCPH